MDSLLSQFLFSLNRPDVLVFFPPILVVTDQGRFARGKNPKSVILGIVLMVGQTLHRKFSPV